MRHQTAAPIGYGKNQPSGICGLEIAFVRGDLAWATALWVLTLLAMALSRPGRERIAEETSSAL